jgi:hypothetical protein
VRANDEYDSFNQAIGFLQELVHVFRSKYVSVTAQYSRAKIKE